MDEVRVLGQEVNEFLTNGRRQTGNSFDEKETLPIQDARIKNRIGTEFLTAHPDIA